MACWAKAAVGSCVDRGSWSSVANPYVHATGDELHYKIAVFLQRKDFKQVRDVSLDLHLDTEIKTGTGRV